MDISLYSCDKSEVKEPSVGPKARKSCRMAAAPKRRVKLFPSESGSTKTVEHKPLQRTLSTFRWRSSPDVVEGSLIGMSFTISGTLDCLTSEDIIEMIETCGGTVYKTLAKKSQYLVIGNKVSNAWIKSAIDLQKTIINEKEFIDLVKTKGNEYKFFSYRDKEEDSDEDTGSDICVLSGDDSEE